MKSSVEFDVCLRELGIVSLIRQKEEEKYFGTQSKINTNMISIYSSLSRSLIFQCIPGLFEDPIGR